MSELLNENAVAFWHDQEEGQLNAQSWLFASLHEQKKA